MESRRLGWSRFWCPPDGTFHLDGPGYLVDPAEHPEFNPNCLPLGDVRDEALLILLGEPGIGKTDVVRNCGEGLADSTLHLDLRGFATRLELESLGFGGPEISAWRASGQTLELFLDSYDECLLRSETLSVALVDFLNAVPIDRLALRIACRTAVWPTALEGHLKSLFGGARVLELVPLRRLDVVDAARRELGDSTLEFLDAVEATRSGVALASRPLTLSLLLGLWKKRGSLPENELDLFEDALLVLCEDDRAQVLTQFPRSTSSVDRLAFAKRIAGVSVLAGKSRFSSSPDAPPDGTQDLLLHALSQPGEGAHLVAETLDTGLFTSRGDGFMGWSHQSYADYLAAKTLAESEQSSKRLTSLLLSTSPSGRERVPAQIQGLTTWLILMNRGMEDRVLEAAPALALDAALSNRTNADMQARALKSYLAAIDAGDAMVEDWSLIRRFTRLEVTPAAIETLRSYVLGRDSRKTSRTVALHAIRRGQIASLYQDVLSVALDASDEPSLRADAIGALIKPAAQDIPKLDSLLDLDADQDPDDEIRGSVLCLLWPAHIDLGRVLAVLKRPRNGSLLGDYWSFLRHEFVFSLQPEQLAVVLEWLGELPSEAELPFDLQELMKQCFSLAEASIRDGAVLHAYAKCLARRLSRHEDASTSLPAESRRALLLGVLELLVDDREATLLGWGPSPLVRPHDLPWLLATVEAESDSVMQRRLASLVPRVLDVRNPEAVKGVLNSVSRSTVIEEAMRPIMAPIDLQSREVEWMRRSVRSEESSNQMPNQELVSDRVGAYLGAFEEGDLDAWWQLNAVLAQTDTSQGRAELETDLSSFSSWTALPIDTRLRATKAAREYLLMMKPEPDWFSPSVLDRRLQAAVRALRLIEASAFEGGLAGLEGSLQRWLPVVIFFPHWRGGDSSDSLAAMACTANSLVPDQVAAAIRSHPIPVADPDWCRRLHGCWGPSIGESVAELLLDKGGELPVDEIKATLRTLSTADAELGATTARALLVREFEDAPERSTAILTVLIEFGGEDGVRVLRDIGDDDLLSRAFLDLAHMGESRSGTLAGGMSEASVAELYLLLLRLFPRESDPDVGSMGAHMVSPRESVGRWRDGLISHLRDRGTRGSVEALSRLLPLESNAEWLQHSILLAEERLAAEEWRPLEPSAAFRFISEGDSWIVQTSAQLLDVLIWGIRRFQEYLVGETPMVRNLWSPQAGPDDLWRPRPEAHLSDNLKTFLDLLLVERHLIVNREVEVATAEGGAPGERTDIHVDAVSHLGERLRAVIEVKCSWNDSVATGISDQLAERYLAKHGTTAGLYVVGFFASPLWDASDSRRTRAARWTLSTLRDELDNRVNRLPDGLMVTPVILDCELASS